MTELFGALIYLGILVATIVLGFAAAHVRRAALAVESMKWRQFWLEAATVVLGTGVVAGVCGILWLSFGNIKTVSTFVLFWLTSVGILIWDVAFRKHWFD